MNPIRRLWNRLIGDPASRHERRAMESQILYGKRPRPSRFPGQDEFAPLAPVPADFSPAPRYASAGLESAERERFISTGGGVYDGAGASASDSSPNSSSD